MISGLVLYVVHGNLVFCSYYLGDKGAYRAVYFHGSQEHLQPAVGQAWKTYSSNAERKKLTLSCAICTHINSVVFNANTPFVCVMGNTVYSWMHNQVNQSIMEQQVHTFQF